MKNKTKKTTFSFLGYLIFFFTVSAVTALSIILYNAISEKTNNRFVITLVTFIAILFMSLVYTTIDLFRRKFLIEKPVNEILTATEKVMKGDLSVKLEISHSPNNFNEFDVIKQNINDMISELSRQEIFKTDFISNVSHEIKTPLSIILNYANALNNEKLDNETKKQYIQSLTEASKRLNNLITNILKLNKLENQVIVPDNKLVDLNDLISQIIFNFDELISQKNIKLFCDIDEIKILSDASLLEIVFNNLISNAIKFTDSDGKIEISLKQENQHIIIKVKDNGCGIDSESGSHIFDKFYQAETSRSGEGNGLGLALVKQVISLIGGEISVESEVNKGSTFTVKLFKGE